MIVIWPAGASGCDMVTLLQCAAGTVDTSRDGKCNRQEKYTGKNIRSATAG